MRLGLISTSKFNLHMTSIKLNLLRYNELCFMKSACHVESIQLVQCCYSFQIVFGEQCGIGCPIFHR